MEVAHLLPPHVPCWGRQTHVPSSSCDLKPCSSAVSFGRAADRHADTMAWLQVHVCMLRAAHLHPAQVLSFEGAPQRLAPVEGLAGGRSPVGTPNQAWLCLDLYAALARLDEAGLAAGVRALLEPPAQACPEVRRRRMRPAAGAVDGLLVSEAPLGVPVRLDSGSWALAQHPVCCVRCLLGLSGCRTCDCRPSWDGLGRRGGRDSVHACRRAINEAGLAACVRSP